MSRKPARRAGIQALFASRYRLYLRKELDVLLGRVDKAEKADAPLHWVKKKKKKAKRKR